MVDDMNNRLCKPVVDQAEGAVILGIERAIAVIILRDRSDINWIFCKVSFSAACLLKKQGSK